MTHKEQLVTSIDVAATQAYALFDERRDGTPEDITKLKELRQMLQKAYAIAKTLTD